MLRGLIKFYLFHEGVKFRDFNVAAILRWVLSFANIWHKVYLCALTFSARLYVKFFCQQFVWKIWRARFMTRSAFVRGGNLLWFDIQVFYDLIFNYSWSWLLLINTIVASSWWLKVRVFNLYTTNRGFLEGLSIVLDNASSAFVSDLGAGKHPSPLDCNLQFFI